MMQLVTIQEVSDRLGIGEVPLATPALASALKAAHLRIQAELDTTFDVKNGVQEVFFCDDIKHNGIVPEGFFRLRLKKGFVRSDTPVKVESFDTIDQITPDAVGMDITAQCKTNLDRGWVSVPGCDSSPTMRTGFYGPRFNTWYNGKFIRVTYSCGFATPEEAPEAVKEAILGYTPVVIDFSSTTNTSSKKVTHPYEAAGDHALAVLTPYRRRWALSYDPIW